MTVVVPMSKACTRCGETKARDQFRRTTPAQRSKVGLGSWCKTCIAEGAAARYAALSPEAKRDRVAAYQAHRKAQTPEWHAADYEKRRENRLRRLYGIDVAAFDSLLAAQDGLCARCRQPETIVVRGKVIALAVDHDHSCCPGEKTCGKCLRGLLCGRCNKLVGHYEQALADLASALYIQRHGLPAVA